MHCHDQFRAFTRRTRTTLLLLIVLSTAPLASATASNATNAQAAGTAAISTDVTSLGAANLVLPINIPPGAVGTQPALSLIYNSQFGNGAVGQGFVLAGISTISRCGASEPIDGYGGGVYFDQRDRFCLDGERLILVSDGQYGAPQTEYRTERDTFARVVAQGRCGTGPCSFIVTNKDGSRVEFGTTGNSAPVARGRDEIAAWQAARFIDLNDNRVEITYQQNPDQLQSLPRRIDYTLHPASGLAANRHVEFDYQPASRPVVRYAGGQGFLPNQRLVEIRTRVGSEVVTRYRLDYTASASTDRDLLTSVQACAGSGECLPPTRFEWQQGSARVVSANGSPTGQVARGFCGGGGTFESTDFNANGLQDLVCVESDSAYALLSDGRDTHSASGRADGQLTLPRAWCEGAHAQTVWADFDGDRRADLFCLHASDGFKVLRSNGRDLVSPNTRADGGLSTPPQWCEHAAGCAASITNFVGDGRAGLACSCDDGTQKILRSNGTDVVSPNSSAAGVVATGFCALKTARRFWQDFNGDGLGDLVCADGGQWSVLVSDGQRLVSPNSSARGELTRGWCAGADDRPHLADFNGDGLMDPVCQAANGDVFVLLSTGRDVASPNRRADGLVRDRWCPAASARLHWGDFNGDGMSDAVCQTRAGDQLVMVSTGAELVSANAAADGLVLSRWCDGDNAQARITDFNGDGLIDLLCGSADGVVEVQVRDGVMPDLMSATHGALGGSDRFEYAPLTRDDVYSEQGDPQYPSAGVRSPLWVVARHQREDGRGGVYGFGYRYAGARTDLLLRRWLGFEQRERIREADGQRSIYTYSQQYPKAGFILTTEQYGGIGARLSRSEFTPVVLSQGKWVNAVLRASERSSTYTAGQPDYVFETRTEYDDYGSPVLTSDLGDAADSNDDVFDCWRYQNDTANWRLGYVTEHKTVRTEAACRSFLAGGESTWNPDTDLRWDRTGYDARQNVTSLSAWDDGNNTWLVQRRDFDTLGNLIGMTDWAGNATTIEIEDEYRTYVERITSPALSDGTHLVTRTESDPRWGAVVLETDANGSQARYVLDSFGREIQRWGPMPDAGDGSASVLLAETRYVNDAQGTRVELRERPDWDSDDPAQWPFNQLYVDGLSRPWKSRRSGPPGTGPVITETRYDSIGRLDAYSYPRFENEPAAWQRHRYDDFDRVIEVTEPNGSLRRYEYIQGELNVRSTLISDDVQRVTTQQRSVREVLVKSTAGNNGSVEYRYDPLQEPRWIRGPRGDVTEYRYDSLGRPIHAQGADTGERWLTYDAKGRLASVRTGGGVRIDYDYDALGRVLTERIQRSEQPALEFHYAHDGDDTTFGKGHLTRVVSGDTEHVFGYDRYGHIAMESLRLDSRVFTQRSAYNPGGQRTRLEYPDGAVAIFGYDGLDNPTTYDFSPAADEPARRIAEVTTRNALNQIEAMRYGNGLQETRAFYSYVESMHRLKQAAVESANGNANLLQLDYGWNGLGQLQSLQRGGSGQDELSYSFDYDQVGWLKRADGPFGIIDFEYDLAGNITREADVGYRYGENNNQLIESTNGLRAEHDADGNVTQLDGPDHLWKYMYQREALLAQVERDGETVTAYDYDFAGNRLRRTDADGTVSIYVSSDYDITIESGQELHTRYVTAPEGRLYASTLALNPDQVRAQQRHSEALREGGAFDWRHALAGFAPGAALLTLGLALMLAVVLVPFPKLASETLQRAVIGLLVVSHVTVYDIGPAEASLSPGNGLPQEGELYFHHDHLGSSVLVTNAEGQVSSVVAYRPHGALDQPRSSGPDDFRPKYTGKELDAPAGLIFMQARYLHPELGRFLSPDPRHQFATPYGYAGNDPYTLHDPDGEFAVTTALIISVVIGASIGAVSGAYAGAAAVNHDMNPAHWDWREGSTYAGLFAGAAIGAVGGAIGGAAGEAGIALGIAGEVAVGFTEGAVFTAMGGGSPQEIVEGALLGGITGGLGAAGGRAISGLARSSSSLVRRGEASLAEQAHDVSRLQRVARRGMLAEEGAIGESRTARAVGSGTQEQRLIGNSENHALLDELDVCFSFPAGTMVATPDGPRRIETIQPGDSLIAPVPGAEHERDAFRVNYSLQYATESLIEIHFGETELQSTPEHPFLIEDIGWIEAADLQPGQMLRGMEPGQTFRIDKVRSVATENGPVVVYNFKVAESEQYFAGDDQDQVLVHNPSRCSKRLKAMGRTPSKRSATGRKVIKRMESQGLYKKIGNKEFVKISLITKGPRVWKPVNRQIHMGHIVDAVSWWNTSGYKYGAKAKQVRAFMLDHTNYELEWGPLNSSNGAKLGQTYRRPKGHTGKW